MIIKYKNIENWKNSVIHIESLLDFKESINLINGNIHFNVKSIEEEDKILQRLWLTPRNQGTSLFIKFKENFYLITAKHVLTGGNSNKIPQIVFRVPNLNEFEKNKNESIPLPNFLVNLQAGAPGYRAVLYSDDELDIAIISLNLFYRKFIDELLLNGYEPIEFEKIKDSPEKIANEIFSVGYPGSITEVGYTKTETNKFLGYWSSQIISLQVYSFGKISLLHPSIHYFWTDLSIYPGNSGGPIIENDFIVGFISKQAFIKIPIIKNGGILSGDYAPQKIPFARCIKGKYIKEIILKKYERDKELQR